MCISHRYKMRERESIYKYLEIRENELGERMNEWLCKKRENARE